MQAKTVYDRLPRWYSKSVGEILMRDSNNYLIYQAEVQLFIESAAEEKPPRINYWDLNFQGSSKAATFWELEL